MTEISRLVQSEDTALIDALLAVPPEVRRRVAIIAAEHVLEHARVVHPALVAARVALNAEHFGDTAEPSALGELVFALDQVAWGIEERTDVAGEDNPDCPSILGKGYRGVHPVSRKRSSVL